MSRIDPPPLTDPHLAPRNFFSMTWAKWFHDIYQKLGEVLGTTSSNEMFMGYTVEGGTEIDSDGTDLLIKTEVVKDQPFIHATDSAEVEIDADGNYEIIIESSFTANSLMVAELSLYQNTGSGYAIVPGASSFGGV